MTTRLFFISVATLIATLMTSAAAGVAPIISVRERDGVYLVAARFTVPEPAATARDVLTDYANIPRFMPDIHETRVLDRQDGHVRVEQEAVSRFMMFSRRVHLVLEVDEGTDLIRFRDVCHKSFVQYEGAWTIAASGAGTELTYGLRARPAFSVPGFVLRRLLDRDAHLMIERLRTEIGARAISS